jgi:ATP adenylyltransferase/5',5'''-P-1,P-4-tetraphosphate phosphorylase II
MSYECIENLHIKSLFFPVKTDENLFLNKLEKFKMIHDHALMVHREKQNQQLYIEIC